MKITKHQLRRIIREEKTTLIRESQMKERFTDVQDILLWLLEENPGISGADLVLSATEILHRENPSAPALHQEEIFNVLDITLEDGGIFFDDAEDAWYITGEQPNNKAQIQTEAGDKMKITKRQLRNIIKESCGLETAMPDQAPTETPASEVPVPADYEAVRDMLEQNPDVIDMGISAVMNMAGTGCERSTAQGIIDHLQDMVAIESGAAVELVDKNVMPPLPSSSMEMIKGPGFTV